jgi:hypothetical protein
VCVCVCVCVCVSVCLCVCVCVCLSVPLSLARLGFGTTNAIFFIWEKDGIGVLRSYW